MLLLCNTLFQNPCHTPPHCHNEKLYIKEHNFLIIFTLSSLFLQKKLYMSKIFYNFSVDFKTTMTHNTDILAESLFNSFKSLDSVYRHFTTNRTCMEWYNRQNELYIFLKRKVHLFSIFRTKMSNRISSLLIFYNRAFFVCFKDFSTLFQVAVNVA